MTAQRIYLLGGTGFVGARLAARLAQDGHAVTVLTRRAERHRELLVLPTVKLVEGDPHNPVFLRRQFEQHDAVINLVGILNERGFSGRGFTRTHAQLPEKIVEACRYAKVKRLLHMSALNASLKAPSHYLRTKALGEDTVHRAHGADLAVTSFRPSVIFGARDGFLNRFAGLIKKLPGGVFPLACPNAKFQPVYVDDVVECFTRALADRHTFGQRYDLCGPRTYTLREIVEYVATLLGKPTRLVELPDSIAFLQALTMELVPGKPFSIDNYRSLKIDSVCSKGFPAIFGITPQTLEQVAPSYLTGARKDRYYPLRSVARRD
jgi:NADH dehydrogenase